MNLQPNELRERFRGALLGFAIGDALGFPYRGRAPQELHRRPLPVDDFGIRSGFSRGQFTDDTQLLLSTANAIVEAKGVDGRAVAQHFAWLWVEGSILDPQESVDKAMQALQGGTPWVSSGAPLGVRDPSCLSRGIALGLLGEEAISKLAHHAHVVTVMTHKDPACTAAVLAVARCIQLRISDPKISPRRTCEELAQAAMNCDRELASEIFYLPRILGWSSERAMATLREVGVIRKKNEVGLPAHLLPVLLVALYATLKYPLDFRAAIAAVLANGGEVDVAAGLTAAFFGAGFGSENLPPRLRKNLLYRDELTASADALFAFAASQSVAARSGSPAVVRLSVEKR